MHLLTLGLNHQTAPIEIRERAAFGPDTIQQALADLTQSVGASEAAILSTCNRTEIYCGQESDNCEGVFAWLSGHSGLGPEELKKSVSRYTVGHSQRKRCSCDYRICKSKTGRRI